MRAPGEVGSFAVSEEQKQLCATVRRFVSERIRPLEADLDPDESELEPGTAASLVAETRRMGLYNLDVPAEYGGPGIDTVTLALLAMEMSQHRAGLYAPCYGAFGGTGIAQLYEADPDQKERYLYPALRGEKRAFFGLTEPSGGSDPARAIRTRAVRDGNDWIINGSKVFISDAHRADFGLVFARTGGAGRGGISCFIVDTDTPGFRVERVIRTLRSGACPTELSFTDMRVPAASLLGKYGKAAEAEDFIRRRIKAVPWDSEAKVQLARALPAGSAEREPLLATAVTDTQAAYTVRAEAARMSAPRPVAGVSGTELELLSSARIAPDAAAKPYQVEARIDAARQAADPEVRLRLWREALAFAPAGERVRLGALRAAIALRRDSLALAMEQPGQSQLPDAERADIAESLAAAAERLDDLQAAEAHLRTAINLRPPAGREALERQLNALEAEQNRRAKNAARQPVVRNAIEQDHVVRPRILRSAQ